MTDSGNAMRYLEMHSRERPNHIALRFVDREYTYAEVHEETGRLAQAFGDLGVQRGDTICLIMPNCPEFVFTWYALARLGAITVPINGEYTEDRLARLINTASAEIVVVDSRYSESLSSALTLGTKVHTIIHHGSRPETGADQFRTIEFSTLGAGKSDAGPWTSVGPLDTFMLVFTSGSTGEAKAVEISHGFAESFTTSLANYAGYNRDDVLFTCFPLFHADAALTTVLPALILGGTAAIVERFSASRFWDQIRSLEATAFTAMGAVQGILLNRDPSEGDRDHQVRVTVAGAVHDRVREFEDRFGLQLIQVYGGTEFGLVAFHRDGRPAPGIIGRATEYHEILVADDDDVPVPPGTTGQLLVRPRVPQACMSGYYGDGAETARVWRNLWYHTGDLGYVDNAGVLHFAGRAKDVIRRRGRNIPPAEIETVLRTHPDVLDCAAIAVPSELIEDEIKAVIESRPGTNLGIDDIAELARQRLPRYMQPRYIEIVEEIPKTPTGKLNKPKLRQDWKTPSTVDLDRKRTDRDERSEATAGGTLRSLP
ncbi:AMP-binding protein [Nocardia sp. CA-119907]|uniref:AMP-binding protein n=1 Tax=Nocardia sp. CA-119907 TaxID=3239973 RepID=UPI003D990763